jgi:N-acetylglutamate synthase-like GNAT family acetyltransferase
VGPLGPPPFYGRVMEIRRATANDVDGCVAVLAALNEYFTSDTHDDLRARFDTCTVYVADDDGEIIGCVLLQPQYDSGEIYYAGVLPGRHRQGVGRELIARLLGECGLAVVEVKTLDASSSYEPYVPTRAFWAAMGFVQIDCIDPLPGWQPGNPAAIYVCALRLTR